MFKETHTQLWGFPVESWSIVTEYMWFVSFRHESLQSWHKTPGWPATANEHCCGEPPSYCTWRLSEESLAVMSVHALNDSPHTESLTLLAERTKELVLSQDLAITIQMWESDLEILRLAWILSESFTFPKVATRPAHSTPWSWLKFLSLRLPGFCLWSLNLRAVICQLR